jgi:hypothetical protein
MIDIYAGMAAGNSNNYNEDALLCVMAQTAHVDKQW